MNYLHQNYQTRSEYPFFSLPKELKEFILSVSKATDSTVEVVTPVVLSAIGAATQGVVDVKGPSGTPMPTSLYFFVAVPSGGRKSSIMRLVTTEFEAFEQNHLGTEQSHPFVFEETTPQGLIDVLKNGARSVYFAFDEGHQLFNRLDAASFCKLFDGSTIRHTTRKQKVINIAGVRTSMCVMIQNQIFAKHLQKKQDHLISSGFMPRMLFSVPDHQASVQGRTYTPRFPIKEPFNDPFHDRVRALLKDYFALLIDPSAQRQLLTLDDEAQAAWNNYYEHSKWITSQHYPGEPWTDVEPFIKRAPEHALRLAAALQWFVAPQAHIEQWAMLTAIDFVSWHMEQIKRTFGQLSPEEETAHNAAKLYEYLLNKLRANGVITWHSRSELLSCAPVEVRKADKLQSALLQLCRQQLICFWKKGRKEFICLNGQAQPAYGGMIANPILLQ